jgi:hypothetical protein
MSRDCSLNPLFSRVARTDPPRSEVARLIEEAVGCFAIEGRRVLVVIARSHSPRTDAAQVPAGLPVPGGRRGCRGHLVGRSRHIPAALQRAERAPRGRDRCRLANAQRKIDTQPRLEGSGGPIGARRDCGELTAEAADRGEVYEYSRDFIDETAGSLRGLCRWLVRGNLIGWALSAWTHRATTCPPAGRGPCHRRTRPPLRYTRNVLGDAVAEHVLVRVARSRADHGEGA